MISLSPIIEAFRETLRQIRVLIEFLWRTLRLASIETYRAAILAIKQTIAATLRAIRFSWQLLRALQNGLAIIIELIISVAFYIVILTGPIIITMFPRNDPWLLQYEGFHWYKVGKLILIALTALLSISLLREIFKRRTHKTDEVDLAPSVFERNLTKCSQLLSWLIFSAFFLVVIVARLEVLGIITVPDLHSGSFEHLLSTDIQEQDTIRQHAAGSAVESDETLEASPSTAQPKLTENEDLPQQSFFQVYLLPGIVMFGLIFGFIVLVHFASRRAYD